jgi:uncharacterized ubiquitin-like protein YukD
MRVGERGRPRRDLFYIKRIWYNGGLVDTRHNGRLFGVDDKRYRQIINHLLYEGAQLENGKRLFLFDRAGLRGDKIRMVTHASSTEILLATGFILIVVSAPFLENWRLSLADGLYSLERLVTLLFTYSTLLIYFGAVILAFYTYTKHLCGLGKKLHLRIKFKYKHKSYPETIKVKENITVRQLIELTLKKSLKKHRVIVENYVAKLDQNNKLLVLDRNKRLYEYGIRDKDIIVIKSPKRKD